MVAKIYFECSTKKDVSVAAHCAESMGWRVVTDPIDADIIWEGPMMKPDAGCFRMGLKPHQRVNYFPGVKHATHKCELSRILNRAQRLFPHVEFLQGMHIPTTFSLPAEAKAFRSYAQEKLESHKGARPVYIVKPSGGCGGEGIFLTDDFDSVLGNGSVASSCAPKGPVVIQEYLPDPLLLGGLKFDMRLYVAVTSLEPLRFYVHREGLARMAVEPYELPNKYNYRKLNMHLTNYSLNKFSKDFVANEDADDDSECSKRTVTTAFRQLEEEHGAAAFNAGVVWSKIEELVGATLAAMGPFVLNHCCAAPTAGDNGAAGCYHSYQDHCFQLMGFDVILTKDCEPVLLEVNAHPSLQADAPVDVEVKNEVVGTLMKMIGQDALVPGKKIGRNNAEVAAQALTKMCSESRQDRISRRADAELRFAKGFGTDPVVSGSAHCAEVTISTPLMKLLNIFCAATASGRSSMDGLTSTRFNKLLRQRGAIGKKPAAAAGSAATASTEDGSAAPISTLPSTKSLSSAEVDMMFVKLTQRWGIRTLGFPEFVDAVCSEGSPLGEALGAGTPAGSLARLHAVCEGMS